MLTRLKGWLVPLLLLGATAYALAEELTLTTYYPSPRGVYQELRVSGNLGVGTTAPDAVLDVRRAALDTGIVAQMVHNNYTNGGLVVFNSDTVTGGLMVNQESESNGGQIIISNRARLAAGGHQLALARTGEVGIGTAVPGAKLDVNGTVKLGAGGAVFTSLKSMTFTWDPEPVGPGLCTNVRFPLSQTDHTLIVLAVQIPVPGGANDATENFAGSCDGNLASTPASSTSHVWFSFRNKSSLPVDQGPQQWTVYYLEP